MIKPCFDCLFERFIWLYAFIISRTHFRVNPHYIFFWMARNSFARNQCDIWCTSDCNGTPTHNPLIRKRTVNHLTKLVKWLSSNVSTHLYVHLTVYSYHVTYAFQSKSTLYIFLNIKELLCSNMRYILSLSDCNGTRTYNLLVYKRTLSHLAKLTKWLNCVLSTYLYGVFHFMFLSCHVRISEWIYTVYLPECQETPLLCAIFEV